MKLPLRFLLIGAFAATVLAANAQTLFFDDLADDIPLLEEYAGFGVHSDGASFVREGLGNGDSGNWGLEGTNGSKFLGNNGDEAFTTTLNFDTSLTSLAFDISRSNGSGASDTWEARVYDGSNVLIQTLSGQFNAINQWTNVAFNFSGIRSLEIQSFGSSFRPYGVDDVRMTPVPEPASMLVIGAGIAALLRRRRSKA